MPEQQVQSSNPFAIANRGLSKLSGTLKQAIGVEPTPQEDCERRGGVWDPTTNTCRLPQAETPQPAAEPATKDFQPQVGKGTSEVFLDPQTGQGTGITRPDGTTFLGPFSKEQEEQFLASQRSPFQDAIASGEIGQAGSLARRQRQLLEGQQLAGQVGQIDPATGLTATPFDVEEAASQGLAGAIPRALGLAATGAGIGLAGGLAGGPVAPVTAPAGAAIGAVAGFVSGIASSIISNARSQRRDNTNAQKRTLDEGKQTLADWVTLARSDPSNRATYLAQFNNQLTLINRAHQQMKVDTQSDVLKFETAIPDLAEFEEFYGLGGERDALVQEMQAALIQPTEVDYAMLELARRRT